MVQMFYPAFKRWEQGQRLELKPIQQFMRDIGIAVQTTAVLNWQKCALAVTQIWHLGNKKNDNFYKKNAFILSVYYL